MGSLASPSRAVPSRSQATFPAALGAALFAAALIAVGAHHEAWFDEAQAWLLARDSTLPDLLLERLHYEGSPGLWHALLWLAMQAGYPFSGLWLLSSALAVSGAFLVLRAAPFPIWLRIGLIGSYFFAYQYAIVARSYALDLLLIPLAAILFPGRVTRPLPYAIVLGLLANANAHSFLVAGTLGAEATLQAWRTGAWSRTAFLGSMALAAILALAAVLQAWPAPDLAFGAATEVSLNRAIRLLREALVDRVPLDEPVLVATLVSFVLLIPSLLLFRRAGTLGLSASLILCLMVFSALKPANVWHSGILFLVWVFCLWISWQGLRACGRGLRGLVLASVGAVVLFQDAETASAWFREVREPYASGPQAAAIVRAARARDPEARVAAVGFKTFSLQPWFARNVFANYDGGASNPAFYVWRRQQPVSPDADLASFRRAVAGGYDLIALSTYLPGGSELGTYVSVGSENGYCPSAEVSGHLIWKTERREPDGIVFFARCPPARGGAD